MEWTVVKVSQNSGRNVPFVSIGRGQMDFNAVSCDLIHDNGQYKYVQLLTGKENGKQVVAVKFLEEADLYAIPVKRKKQNGKVIKGITVVNKDEIKKLFGKNGSNDGMIRYSVELIDHNMLKIID